MRYFIQGEEITPRDWTNIGQVREFVDSDNQIKLTTNSVKLTGRGREIVYKWVYEDYGRFLNIPIEVMPKNGPVIPMYLDIVNSLQFTDTDVTSNIVIRKSSNHFFEAANNLTFELLHAKGLLTNFTKVPYQIFAVTTRLERLVLIANTIVMAIQLVNAVFELAKLIADALDVVGTGVLTAIAKAVAYAAWVIGLLFVIIQQAQELRNIYAPPVRYLRSKSDYDLIAAGCQYLGFTFQSDFIAARRQIETLPVTEFQPGKSIFELFEFEMPNVIFNKGYPRAGDTVPTLLPLINWWLEFYNLEIKVYNGIVRIETPEFFAQTANVTLETALPDQEGVQDAWRYNNGENRVWRRKFLSWSNDPQDVHTQDNSVYNVAEYLTQNILIPPGCEDLSVIRGFSNLEAPFALLQRKGSLFPLEKLIFNFFTLLDKVANAFGGNSHLASNFADPRIGIGVISGQYFGITKKIWNAGNGKQPGDYRAIKFNTDVIYEQRHKSLEVKVANSKWRDMRVPMHDETFNILQSNNYAFLDTGEQVKVLSCTYFEEDDHRYANVTLQQEDDSGFNLETIKIA